VWGAKWTSHNGDLPVEDSGVLTLGGSLWAQGLAGFTERRIIDALQHFAVRGDEWPPNLPMVRNRCAGLPDLLQVKREITQPDADRSPFTRAVWHRMDGYTYRLASVDKADRMLREAYEATQEAVMCGEALPEPSKAIEHEPPPPTVIPDDREARIERMKKLLGPDFNPEAALAKDEDATRRKHRKATEQALLDEIGTTP
jgi:hypothetical protein